MIFISYSSKQTERVMKLKSGIDTRHGNRYETWMSYYNMQGAPLTAMGEYLQKASMVIMCVSSSYERSEYCLAEACMAMERNKKRLVLILEKDYYPTRNNTLEPIVARPMRIECTTDEMLENYMEKIFGEIEKAIRERFPFLLLHLNLISF